MHNFSQSSKLKECSYLNKELSTTQDTNFCAIFSDAFINYPLEKIYNF